jgi:hypothetical protein
MMPIDTTGLLGGSRTTSAERIASSTPGAGGGAVQAGDDETLRGSAARMAHPPLLEVDRSLRPSPLVDDDVGLDRGVGHRQQRHAAVGQSPALGRRARHLG